MRSNALHLSVSPKAHQPLELTASMEQGAYENTPKNVPQDYEEMATGEIIYEEPHLPT